MSDILFRFLIEPGNIVLVIVNTGADGKRDPDGRYDNLTLVKSLDLNFHLTEILLSTSHYDIAFATIAKPHHNNRVDLCKHFLVDVLGLSSEDASEKNRRAEKIMCLKLVFLSIRAGAGTASPVL